MSDGNAIEKQNKKRDDGDLLERRPNSLLITYDLCSKDGKRNYGPLLGRIRALGTVERMAASTYLVETTTTEVAAFNVLARLIRATDRLVVVDVTDQTWTAARFWPDAA